MGDNLPIYMKDRRATGNNPMDEQQSVSRMRHEPTMRPESFWDSNPGYRNVASASAHQQHQHQQQQARGPLWDSEKNFSGAVLRPGLDTIDMTMLQGRPLYSGLASNAGESISAQGAMIPSSVHQLHRGSPSVSANPVKSIPTGSGGKQKHHAYKEGIALDTQGFLEAVRKQNYAEIKRFLEKGFDVNYPYENGSTPLHIAAKNGDHKLLEMLIMYGADTAKRDKMGKLADDYLKASNISMEINRNIYRQKDKQSMNYLGWPGTPAPPMVPDMLLYQTYQPFADFQKYTQMLTPSPLLGHPTSFTAPGLGRLQPELLSNHEKQHAASASIVPPPSYERFSSSFDYLARPPINNPTLYNTPQSKYISSVHDETSPLNNPGKYNERPNSSYSHQPKGKSPTVTDLRPARNSKRDVYESYPVSKPSKSHDYRPENEVKHRHNDKSSFHIEHLVRTSSSSPLTKQPRNSNEFSGRLSYPPAVTSNYQDSSVLARNIDANRIKAPLSTNFYGPAELPHRPPGISLASAVSNSPVSSAPYYSHHQNGESSFSPYHQKARHVPTATDIMLKRPQEPQTLPKMATKHHSTPHTTVLSSYYGVTESSVGSVITTPAPLNGWSSKGSETYLQPAGDLPRSSYLHSSLSHNFTERYLPPSPPRVNEITSASKHKPVPSIAKLDNMVNASAATMETSNTLRADAGTRQQFNGSVSTVDNAFHKDVSLDNTDNRSVIVKSPPTEKPYEHQAPESIVAAGGPESAQCDKLASKSTTPIKSSELNFSGKTSSTETISKKGRKRKAGLDSNEQAEKTKRSKSNDVDSTSTDTLSKSLSDDVQPAVKRTKKSDTDDDFLWVDDFSTDPENDDSGDEDFCCPVVKPIKSRNTGMAKRRPKRRPSRRQGQAFNGSSDHSMEVPSDSEQILHRKKHKQRQKRVLNSKQIHMRKSKAKKLRTISSESGSSFKEHLSQSDEEVDKATKTRSSKRRKPLDRGRLKRKLATSNGRLKDRLLKSQVSEKLARKSKQQKLKRKQKKNQQEKQSGKIKFSKVMDKPPEDSKNDAPANTINTNATTGISATFMELYTGTKPPLQPPDKQNQSANLFGDELTEKEALVLSKPMNVVEQTAERAPVPSDTFPDGEVSQQSNDNLDQVTKATHNKPKKKRGRKPKCSSETNNSIEKKLKKQKLASHLKEKFSKHKLLKKQHPAKVPSSGNKLQEPSNQDVSKEVFVNTPKTKKIVEERKPVPSPSLLNTPHEAPSFSTPMKVKEEYDPERSMSLDCIQDTPSTSKMTATFNDFRTFQPGKLSRSSTPLSFIKDHKMTPHPSPVPPNLKKLTCNSAIGETVLHKAARFGYLENVQHYLERGTDVNIKDNAGYSALHEACVQNQLETARLLLRYGANVNLNSTDGTRPIHDAIEYDHLEMTRLLLSCGADPLLSKFSGRSIKHMIRSKNMENFFAGYLKELKPQSNVDYDSDLEWIVAPSCILDKKVPHGYEMTDHPPSSDEEDFMEFKVFDQPPLQTYYVQPTVNCCRSNYYLLVDLLGQTKCSRGDFLLSYPVDIKTMTTEAFLADVSTNWVPNKLSSVPNSVIESDLVELVESDRYLEGSTSYKVFDDGEVEIICPTNKESQIKPMLNISGSSLKDEEPCCSYSTPSKKFTNSPSQKTTSANLDASYVQSCKPSESQVHSRKRSLDFGNKSSPESGCPTNHHSSSILPVEDTPEYYHPYVNNVATQNDTNYLDKSTHRTNFGPEENGTNCSPKGMQLPVHLESPFKKYDERKLENGFCGLSAANVHLNANTL